MILKDFLKDREGPLYLCFLPLYYFDPSDHLSCVCVKLHSPTHKECLWKQWMCSDDLIISYPLELT